MMVSWMYSTYNWILWDDYVANNFFFEQLDVMNDAMKLVYQVLSFSNYWNTIRHL